MRYKNSTQYVKLLVLFFYFIPALTFAQTSKQDEAEEAIYSGAAFTATFFDGASIVNGGYYAFDSLEDLRAGRDQTLIGSGHVSELGTAHNKSTFVRIRGDNKIYFSTDPTVQGIYAGNIFAHGAIESFFHDGDQYYVLLNGNAKSQNGEDSYSKDNLIAFSTIKDLTTGNNGTLISTAVPDTLHVGASSSDEVFRITETDKLLVQKVSNISKGIATNKGSIFVDSSAILSASSDGKKYYLHFNNSARLAKGNPVLSNASYWGFLTVGHKDEPIPEGHEWGSFHYTNVFPLLHKNNLRQYYQSGLPGTWLSRNSKFGSGVYDIAKAQDDTLKFPYTTIEGGVGLWGTTRFVRNNQKFLMGGVAAGFGSFANGPGQGVPGWGRGNGWADNLGRYGVAQLSNRALFPLDMLNIENNTTNKMFGYGYHPLPLTEPKLATPDFDAPTGNKNWTLFLNTENFKGPLAFFTPAHWSRRTIEKTYVKGELFDNTLMNTPRNAAMETQPMPAVSWTAPNGDKYYRAQTMRFPADSDGVGRLFTKLMSPNSGIWDSVENWFAGGPVAPTSFTGKSSSVHTTNILGFGDVNTGWKFKEESGTTFVQTDNFMTRVPDSDPSTSAIQWNMDIVTRLNSDLVMLPKYFRYKEGDTRAIAITEAEVPVESGLTEVKSIDDFSDFHNVEERMDDPIETPMHPDYVSTTDIEKVWTSPGPFHGPHHAVLDDGSTATYYWYKFNEQPSILNSNMNDSERALIQSRVELIHSNWKHTDTYFPDPNHPLASLDQALILTPPNGMEVGYVPITVNQQLTSQSLPNFPVIDRR